MRLAPALFLITFASTAACGGSERNPSNVNNNGGSGNDGGGESDASTSMDAGAADTGIAGPRDTGIGTACNPLDGTGCMGAQRCVFVGDPFHVQCRDLAMPPKQIDEMCSGQLHDCDVGFACIGIQGDRGGPRCRKICRLNTNTECMALMGSNPDGYSCSVTIDRDLGLGVCAPVVPECLPFNDMCRRGQYCEDSGGRLQCLPQGMAEVGEACPTNRCEKGAICVFMNGNGLCYEPCDHQAQMSTCSTAGETCQEVTEGGRSMHYGICRP
jgi:hypothetical protein